jgi:PAS domain S-box-containing protein
MPYRLPVMRQHAAWIRYGATALMVATAELVTPLVPPVAERATFALFFGAIAISSALWGMRPGLFATGLSVFGILVWLAEPGGALRTSSAELIRVSVFVAVAIVICALGELRLRRERAERALRVWSEVVLASIGDAVIVADENGRVLSMNPIAESLTGWAEAQADGRPLCDVFRILNEKTRETVEDPTARIRRDGKAVGLANHTILVARDGREVPIDDSGAPICSEDGRVVGAVLVFRDITQRRADERRTQRLLVEQADLLESERAARAEAQEASRSKDEFLAILSHELRTPLNAIVGWTSLLREAELPEAQRARAIETIDRNAKRQARLIDDVLDVSRIVARRLRLEFAAVDLSGLVQEAVEAARPTADAKGLHIAYTASGPVPVVGDAPRLVQVAANLLSNAIRFTDPGGTVTVDVRESGPHAQLEVRDTGEGIDPEFLPHVFEQFRQQDSSISRRHGGLGLGLAIVKHLVELHAGTATAESSGRGHGSVFTIRIPLAHHTGIAVTPHHAEAMVDLDGVRVLVVDDELDTVEVIAAMLRAGRAEVRETSSPEAALEIIESWRPSVLLFDIAMPGLDGYSLLERVRARGLHTLAIALSAHIDTSSRQRAHQAGFALFVPKPVRAGELVRQIASLVEFS